MSTGEENLQEQIALVERLRDEVYGLNPMSEDFVQRVQRLHDIVKNIAASANVPYNPTGAGSSSAGAGVGSGPTLTCPKCGSSVTLALV